MRETENKKPNKNIKFQINQTQKKRNKNKLLYYVEIFLIKSNLFALKRGLFNVWGHGKDAFGIYWNV